MKYCAQRSSQYVAITSRCIDCIVHALVQRLNERPREPIGYRTRDCAIRHYSTHVDATRIGE